MIEKYMINLPCFLYSGTSFFKKNSAAPYSMPIGGEIKTKI